MAWLKRHAAHSNLLDSRIELWAWRSGLDPGQVRRDLGDGHTIVFTDNRSGEELHRIRPGELI